MKRTDPMVPILASAVGLVVVGAIGLVFYPRVARMLGPDRAQIRGVRPSPASTIPVWVCRSVEGVALLLEGLGATQEIDAAVEDGPYHYLRLSVVNFGGDEPYVVPLSGALTSPGGGPSAVAVARILKGDVPGHLQPVLRGLGAVEGLEVAKGHRGQALFGLKNDPASRSAFALGSLMFERRELERQTIAAWRRDPDLKKFMDF
ncbi:MAG: hypothetical protein ACYTGN_15550 [Planctomycetota bacterium]|jgi:hypothetical protein